MVPKLQCVSESPAGLVKPEVSGPYPPDPTVSGSVVLGQGLRICIYNKFPGDADKLGATLWEPLSTFFDLLYDLHPEPLKTKQQQKSVLSHSAILAFY